MATLWLNRIVIIGLGWLAVSCVIALIFGQVIAHGKRQEAKARRHRAAQGLQERAGGEPVPDHVVPDVPDIRAMTEKHDAGA